MSASPSASACGLCEDRRRAEFEGPLRAVKGFCACDPCLLLKTDACLLPQLMGTAMRAKAPLAKGVPARTPQLLSLEAYADWLEAKRLVAVSVDESELELEGPYWLALLTGAAFVVEHDMMYAGQEYRAGWTVVPAQWYRLRQSSERGYELLPDEARRTLPEGGGRGQQEGEVLGLTEVSFCAGRCCWWSTT